MYIIVGDLKIEVVITKKLAQKNTYIRVKDDMKVYVTTNKFVSDREVKRIIEENMDSINRMYNKQLFKQQFKNNFFYLGKKYDIIKTNSKEVVLGLDRIFIPANLDIDKWLKKQAEKLFKERLDYWYSRFTYEIPYPSLTIRKMTTRWGVCNTKSKRVTLNFELIRKDPACLDYVINHELSHFIESNHSRNFWKVVEENYPDYKKIRRIMKNY